MFHEYALQRITLRAQKETFCTHASLHAIILCLLDTRWKRSNGEHWNAYEYIDNMWSNDRNPMYVSFHAMQFNAMLFYQSTRHIFVYSDKIRQFSNGNSPCCAMLCCHVARNIIGKKRVTNEWAIGNTIFIGIGRSEIVSCLSLV